MPACRFEREVWRMLTMMFKPFWYNILAVKPFVFWRCCYYNFQQIMPLILFSGPGCEAFYVSKVRLIMIIVSVMYDYWQWHYGLFQILAITPFLSVMYDYWQWHYGLFQVMALLLCVRLMKLTCCSRVSHHTTLSSSLPFEAVPVSVTAPSSPLICASKSVCASTC